MRNKTSAFGGKSRQLLLRSALLATLLGSSSGFGAETGVSGRVDAIIAGLTGGSETCSADCGNLEDALKYFYSAGNEGDLACRPGSIPAGEVAGLFCDSPRMSVVSLPRLAAMQARISKECFNYLSTLSAIQLGSPRVGAVQAADTALLQTIDRHIAIAKSMSCFPLTTFDTREIAATAAAATSATEYCNLVQGRTQPTSCPSGYKVTRTGDCRKSIRIPGLASSSLTFDPSCRSLLANDPELADALAGARAQGLSACSVAGGPTLGGRLTCSAGPSGFDLSSLEGYQGVMDSAALEQSDPTSAEALARSAKSKLLECKDSSTAARKASQEQLAYAGTTPGRPAGAAAICKPREGLDATYSPSTGACTRVFSAIVSSEAEFRLVLSDSCMAQKRWAKGILENTVGDSGIGPATMSACTGKTLTLNCSASGITYEVKRRRDPSSARSATASYGSLGSLSSICEP